MKNPYSRKIALVLLIVLPALVWAGNKNNRAVTNWLVIFNNWEACTTSPCGEADIFLEGNAAEVAICYLTGQVVPPNGRATFAASFAADQNYDCFHPMDGGIHGLADDSAEVHIVVQEHGAALKPGAGLEEQVAYFLGACNPDCVDTQFAIHLSGATGETTTVPMQRFSDGSAIKNSASTLIRQGDGIRSINHTRLDRPMDEHDDDSDSDSESD